MNRNFILIILLLFATFAYAECVGGYNDTFYARVLDAKLRPVSNALVSATFDRGATFGPQYLTTPNRTTDNLGQTQFTLINQGTNSRTLDCKIKLVGQVDAVSNTTTIEANVHGDIVDIFLSVYPVLITVKDQFGVPLPNAVVTFDNTTLKADDSGSMLMFNTIGKHNYLVNYLDGKEAGTFEIAGDERKDIVIPYHSIGIVVMDEYGKPLDADISIFNKIYQTKNGQFAYAKSFGDQISYKVDYNGSEIQGNIIPESKPNVTVVYDLNAPVFQNIKDITTDNRPQLIIQVVDLGQYASGVEAKSVRVNYRIQKGEEQVWTSATTFTSGKNTFTTQFPVIEPNSIVQFHIEAQDKAGNIALLDGSFSTMKAKNQSNQTPQNDTNTQPNPKNDQGIPLLYIIIGAIIVIFIIYMLFRNRQAQT
ncbi:hypothetical protein HY988_02615 [Candidatus Micrarchaeota archaeon]|nr:hypothetical protein [Candidatus Micrarchaeota archaeon]